MQHEENPKPDIRPPDDEPNPERREPDPEPSEQPGRPMPSGVPNEIQAGTHMYLGEGIYEYKPVRLRSGWCNERGG